VVYRTVLFKKAAISKENTNFIELIGKQWEKFLENNLVVALF